MRTYCFKLYNSKRNRKLHRQIYVAGLIYSHCIALHKRYYKLFGKYLNMYQLQKHLTYAAYKTGSTIVEIDRFYPSSQLCSDCGYQNKEIKNLKVREWICLNCGSRHHRDKNASINIEREGNRILFA